MTEQEVISTGRVTTSMPGSVIACENIDVTYRTSKQETVHALSDVSLEVQPGEFVSIIGPSGCGKSTLLKVLAGMIKQHAGTVTLEGEPLVKPRPDKIGFVFQDYALLPWRTVERNVEFPLEVRKVPRVRRQEIVAKELARVGLSEAAKRLPRELSGGMRQRVAIARALAASPDLLLMDEPFGALDEQTRFVLGQELSQILATTGKTILFVTHSLTEAIMLSDRLVVMSAKPGRVIATISVPEPRPRSDEFLTTTRFAELRNELFATMRDGMVEAVHQSESGADS
jgi:NitT/TauT family transport system ATP-binding protein